MAFRFSRVSTSNDKKAADIRRLLFVIYILKLVISSFPQSSDARLQTLLSTA